MKTMQWVVLALASAVGASGCSPYTMPVGLHPTPGTRSSGGISLGVPWVHEEGQRGTDLFQVPYTEGVLRAKGPRGQLELRASAGMGYVGYNFELAPERSVSVLLEPGLGMAYQRETTSSGELSALTLIPSASLVFTVKEKAYFAPRVAYTYRDVHNSDVTTESTTPGIWSFGGAVGAIIERDPFTYTVELSVLRMSATETDTGSSSDAVWVFMPGIGVHLTRE